MPPQTAPSPPPRRSWARPGRPSPTGATALTVRPAPPAQAAQKAAQELSEQLFGLQAQLNSLPGLVESKDDALAAVKSCVDAVDALTNRVGDLLTPSQSDLAQDIKDVAGQAEGMLDGLKGTAADVRTLLSQAQGLQGRP